MGVAASAAVAVLVSGGRVGAMVEGLLYDVPAPSALQLPPAIDGECRGVADRRVGAMARWSGQGCGVADERGE